MIYQGNNKNKKINKNTFLTGTHEGTARGGVYFFGEGGGVFRWII